jgi:hypothetical protein
MIDEIKPDTVARVLPPVHTTPESAYVIEGWPWGRRLRCRKRFWIESKPKHGQRLVAQTTMPPEKNAAEPWCKPKAGVYGAVVVLYLTTAEGHVHHTGLHTWAYAAYEPEKAQAWLDTFREGIDPKRVEVIEKAIARGHERNAKKAAEEAETKACIHCAARVPAARVTSVCDACLERSSVAVVHKGGWGRAETRQPPARSPEARAVRIWDLMNESERHGVAFGLFPIWVGQADLGGKAPGEGWEADTGDAGRVNAVALMALAKDRREAVTG